MEYPNGPLNAAVAAAIDQVQGYIQDCQNVADLRDIEPEKKFRLLINLCFRNPDTNPNLGDRLNDAAAVHNQLTTIPLTVPNADAPGDWLRSDQRLPQAFYLLMARLVMVLPETTVPAFTAEERQFVLAFLQQMTDLWNH